ncbi:helix-turn-helix transcriptional regulator [Butyrivibrio proteoclasticus]|uniref:helix-turn-helix transcriptional regulator n=1 Tax=Butyrivibrio proteoclasticus TaxID=43305 RepID=UPI00055078C2|nr:helix-turn-helix transcriptional regulator [Butyrivibrio proteoclasticus]
MGRKPKNYEDIAGCSIYKLMRIARNISAKDLAEKLDVTTAYIYAIEAGERQPSDEVKEKCLKALDVDEEVVDLFAKRSKKCNSFEELLLCILKIIVKSAPEP